MYRLLSPLFLLQLFCLYHAYKNAAEYWWYFVIFFIPIFGPIFYLYKAFYSKQNLEAAEEGVKGLFNSNYNLQKLEKEVKYADTIENKTQLANAYTLAARYEEAIELYQSCLKGFNSDDPDLLKSLLKAYYLKEDYKSVVKMGEKLQNESHFVQSDEKIAYAWSLYFVGEKDKALKQFKEMDALFSNYKQRLEFARFLVETKEKEEAIDKLDGLLDELKHMSKSEQRMKRKIYSEIQQYRRSLI